MLPAASGDWRAKLAALNTPPGTMDGTAAPLFCATCTTAPPIVRSDVLAEPVLDANVMLMDVVPVPEYVPAVAQSGRPDNVQEHDAAVWMLRASVPPALGTSREVGDTE